MPQKPSTPESETMRIAQLVILSYESCLSSSIGLPAEMVHAANDFSRVKGSGEICEVTVCGTKKNTLCTGGVKLGNTRTINQIKTPDIVLLPAIWRNPLQIAKTLPWLNKKLSEWSASGSLICAVGNASFLLAESGLLNHRAATTHWSRSKQFKRRYPRINYQDDFLITHSDNFYCVASVNALADLVIHFIERYYGNACAQHIERNFSPEARAPYSRNVFEERLDAEKTLRQLSAPHGARQTPKHRVNTRISPNHDQDVLRLTDWLAENLAEPIDNKKMSTMLKVSERVLHRRTKEVLGLSPQRLLEQIRLDHAKVLLKGTALSTASIAYETGYNNQSYFCKRFKIYAGQTPSEYRSLVQRAVSDVC